MSAVTRLPPEIGDPLADVAAADRAWFDAHPRRRYRLRPTAIGELLPGMAMGPGSWTVVGRLGDARFRLTVGRPPPRWRHDTDRCCAALVARCGHRLNGRSVGEALAAMRAAPASPVEPRNGEPATAGPPRARARPTGLPGAFLAVDL